MRNEAPFPAIAWVQWLIIMGPMGRPSGEECPKKTPKIAWNPQVNRFIMITSAVVLVVVIVVVVVVIVIVVIIITTIIILLLLSSE